MSDYATVINRANDVAVKGGHDLGGAGLVFNAPAEAVKPFRECLLLGLEPLLRSCLCSHPCVHRPPAQPTWVGMAVLCVDLGHKLLISTSGSLH